MSAFRVKWIDAGGRRKQRDFGETAFDLALMEFLKQIRNPKNDRVELVMDAQGEQWHDFREKAASIRAEIRRYRDEEMDGEPG
jgi:hypothetical protein